MKHRWYPWIIFLRELMIFFQVHVSENCCICVWFDITVDFSPALSWSPDQREEKKKNTHKHFIKVTRQWSTMYLGCKNMLLDSIYHEKLLDCEKAEMAAWQECSSLVLIILSVDLPGHPKPGINSGGELRQLTQRHQKIPTKKCSA